MCQGDKLRYASRIERKHDHTADNGVEVSFTFERAGIDSGLTVLFSYEGTKRVFFLPLIFTKQRDRFVEVPDNVSEIGKELLEKFDEALHQAHVSFMDKWREETQQIEGAPLHTQPDWDEVELLQVAIEKMSDVVMNPKPFIKANGMSALDRLRKGVYDFFEDRPLSSDKSITGPELSPSRNI